MQDLYKGFRKVSEDDSKAVLEHDSGHQLSIAKSGLSKKQKHALSKLPLHQAKGTQVVDEQPDAGIQAKSVGANIADAVASKILEGAQEAATPAPLSPEQIARMPEPVATDVETGLPVAKQAGGISAEERYKESLSGPTGPKQQISPLDVAMQGLKPGAGLKTTQQLQQELQAEAAPQETEKGLASVAEPQAGQPQAAPELQQPAAPAAPAVAAPSLAPAIPAAPMVPAKERTPEEILLDPKTELSEKLVAHNNLYMRNLKALEDSREQEKQILSKMEPKRVFSDASVGNKILMAISAIAGGIGAGLTGRENAALKAMDDIFQRDWEAQKEDRTNKLTLLKLNRETLKDEMSARLQTMANLKSIMVAKMEEAEGKYGFGTPAQRRIELARLQLEDDISKLKSSIAERKTATQIRGMMTPGGVPTQATISDPAPYLTSLVPDEKLREGVRKEIARRKDISKKAPEVMSKLEQVFKDYQSVVGQTVGRAKTPESVKDLETKIRDLIPDIEGDQAGQAKEAKVQALLRLMLPGAGDLFDKKEYGERMLGWLQQNVQTPFSDEARINLQAFPSTAILPETWTTMTAEVAMKLPNGKTIMVPQKNVEAVKKDLGATLITK